jgi:hypothetical protein
MKAPKKLKIGSQTLKKISAKDLKMIFGGSDVPTVCASYCA